MDRIFVITMNPAVDVTYKMNRFLLGGTNRVAEVWRTPGGKGLNVLRVLHSLSIPASGVGFLAGKAGEWMLERMRELGIDFEGVMVPGETRSTITMIGDDCVTELLEPGPTVSMESAKQLLEHILQYTHSGDYVVLSGSQCKGLPLDFSAEFAQMAKRRGCLVCVDASGAVLKEVLREPPDIVKVNDSEFREFIGEKEDASLSILLRSAGELLRMGSRLVVITQGASGSIAVTENGKWIVQAPKVPVLNAVGSGDAFFAGLIAGLSTGVALQDALVQATSCGASNAMFSQAGVVEPDDINRLAQQVKILPVG
ncbi:1-phosphofructokinase family hexose kinase [Alicyclobacillus fodiniaquatilis]|uniref:Tagatose-6-phosphate kinase n=1 Tax=Alicyclobacillus fodiniaquatilis TaxID=1661150 RepID=A0ABW4JHU1_9BACL